MSLLYIIHVEESQNRGGLKPPKPPRCLRPCRTRAREHNNAMQKLILNYTRLNEHTHLIHGHEHYNYSCVSTRIHIEDMRTKKVIECAVTSERIVFS